MRYFSDGGNIWPTYFQTSTPKFEIEKLFRSLNFFPKRPHLIGVYALGKAQRLIKLIRDYGYDKTIFIHGSLEKNL